MKNTKTLQIKSDFYTFKKFVPCYNWITSIYSLYDKPSKEKVDIFNEWGEKLNRIYWLTGSKFCFTIYWNVFDDDWILHDVKITKCYNFIM